MTYRPPRHSSAPSPSHSAGDGLSDPARPDGQDVESRARAAALRLLSKRSYSRKELRDKLRQKGFPEEVAEVVTDRLTERGLMDEAAYAGAVVRRSGRKGLGAGRARQELRRRGIPQEYWDEALEELTDSDVEIDRYLRRTLTDLTDPAERQKERRKAYAALSRRGFSGSEIRAGFERWQDSDCDADLPGD